MGTLGLALACFDTKNYFRKNFKFWDTIRNQGFKLQYWSKETDSNGLVYTRYNLKTTTVESEAYEVYLGTSSYLRAPSDFNMLLVVNGGGDFINYD